MSVLASWRRPILRRAHRSPRLPFLRLLPLLLLSALLLTPAAGQRPAAAQAPAEPLVTVDLYGNSLSFRTLPNTLVTAELVGPAGRKAEGLGVGDAQGLAQVFFLAGDARILPGDSITLSRANDKPLRLTVPILGASLVELPAVEGLAPPEAALRLSLTVPGLAQPVEKETRADAQGAFSVDLSAEVKDPDAAITGSLSLLTPEGARFVLALATVDAQITLGAPVLRGRATAGWEISATVTAVGGAVQKLGPVSAGGDGNFMLPLQALGRPIAVGDAVDLSAVGRSGDTAWSAIYLSQIKDITVELDRSADRVTGTAPAGETVLVSAEDLDGRQERFSTVADGAGAFAVDLAPRMSLGSGWLVRAAYASSSNVSVGRSAVLPRIRVGVGMPLSQGLANPGRVMTITLRTETGNIKAQSLAQADDRGSYAVFFGFTQSTPQAGDSLEIAYADNAGDPLLLRIPSLTAVSDVEADTISGQAPAGSRVALRVDGADGPKRFSAQADPGGSYRVDLAGQLDLKRPANGAVTVSTSSAAEFTVSWAAMQLNVSIGGTLQGNFILGNGPAWSAVEAQLLAPDGKVVASGSGQVFGEGALFIGPGGSGSGAQFFLQLADITGTPVSMQPGDRLRVKAGAEQVELVVPPLDAVVFVQSDRITGRTAPDKRVILNLADSPLYFDATAETRSDAAGNFSQDFSGTRNIRHGDFIQIGVDLDGHLVSDLTIAPGLLLDLDQAVLLGAIAPNLEATATLRRGSSTLSRQSTRTDGDGAMFVQFADEQGRPLRLQPGDEVTVTTSDPTQQALSLTVPDLSLDWDLTADTVGGKAPAEGRLTLFAGMVYPLSGSLGFSQGWPEALPGNRFNTAFVPSIDVRPGSRLTLLYRPAQGHYVVHSRTVPILNAQQGGPRACGFGTPYQPVSARLEEGGRPVAEAKAQPSPYDGFFARLLQDAAGQAVKTTAGQRETAQLGGPTGTVDLPVFDLNVDWNSGQVSGQGPASQVFTVQPAAPCWAQRPGGILNFGINFGLGGQTGADGGIASFLPGGATPGSGVELAFYNAAGHRYFRQVYRAQARVHIRKDRVEGQANSLDAASAVLRAAGGQEQARGAAASDGDGAFDLRLKDAAGTARPIEAGDRLLLDAGGQTIDLTVEPLAFDWSAGAPIFGSAPAGRPVQLLLRLKSGASFSIPRQADAAGRFSFKAEDLPPRGGWTLDDVAAIRLEMPTTGGHLIIDQTPGWEGPGPDQRQPTIYLPAAYRGAMARGAAAQRGGGVASRSGARMRSELRPRSAMPATLPATASRAPLMRAPVQASAAWRQLLGGAGMRGAVLSGDPRGAAGGFGPAFAPALAPGIAHDLTPGLTPATMDGLAPALPWERRAWR